MILSSLTAVGRQLDHHILQTVNLPRQCNRAERLTLSRTWFRLRCRQAVRSTIFSDLQARQRSNHLESGNGQESPGISRGGVGDDKGGSDEANHEKPAQPEGSKTQHNRPSRKANSSNDNGDGRPQANGGDASQPEEEQSLLPDDGDNPWREGFRRRHELRQKSGHPNQSRSGPARDPHGSIPHASSGSKRHTGRGGFPGVFQLSTTLVGNLFPQALSRFSTLFRRYESEGLHSAHPVQSLKKMLEKPIEDHRDAREKKEADHAKWLPPGLRSVVVGRNSQFFEEELDPEDLELLSAMEYRATSVLTYILVAVSGLRCRPRVLGPELMTTW